MDSNQKQLMKQAKQYAAFITDIAQVMLKHKVEDLLCVFGMNNEIRNTYLPLSENGEKDLYCNVSDGIHQWLQQRGHQKSGAPKHTSPLVIKKAVKE